MSTRLTGAVAAVAISILGLSGPANAAVGDTGANLQEVHSSEETFGSKASAYIADDSSHSYSIRPACDLGGASLCTKTAPCTADGHDGTLYEVYQDGSAEPLPWRACLTDGEAEHLGALTPATVARAFHQLTWPSSPLIIQPPKGRTLVNFETNFYTTHTHPSRQQLTLLGHRVTIEATPTSYTWHFDPPTHTDTSTSTSTGPDLTTSDPGAAYPDLRITHRYPHSGTAHPSLDTTYTGRYRVDHGAWHDIPETLTVPGTPQTLQILTATPHLVMP